MANSELSIGEEDLPPIISVDQCDLEESINSRIQIPLVQISLEDIASIEAQILKITKKDLPPIIYISAKDLPKILRVDFEDFIPDRDLNNITTNCYHGTSREAAEQIKRQGFRVGSGNVCGSGIYFSVGGISIAQGYIKGTPCIIRARVNWGKVAYLDNPATLKRLGGHISGDIGTNKALSLGYDSLMQSSKYSQKSPTVGIVLGKQGTYVKLPRIEVVELIDPHKSYNGK